MKISTNQVHASTTDLAGALQSYFEYSNYDVPYHLVSDPMNWNSFSVDKSRQRRYVGYGITLLVSLVPFTIIMRPPFYAFPLGILFLYAIYFLGSGPVAWKLYVKAWPVVLANGLMLVWLMMEGARYDLGWGFIGQQPGHILLCTIVGVAFARLAHPRFVWRVFAITAIIIGVYCCWQYFGLHILRVLPPDTPNYYAILFACLLYTLAICSIIQLIFNNNNITRIDYALHIVAFVLAAYSGILTKSRGPLLAFVIVLIELISITLYRSNDNTKGRIWILVIPLLVFITAISLQGVIVGRFRSAVAEVDAASSGLVEGSAGLRLDMWGVALHGFIEHPWQGIGMGNNRYHEYIEKEIVAGRANPKIAQFSDPHNAYLRMALIGGIPGLIIIILFFSLPIYFFCKNVFAKNSVCVDVSLCGLAVALMWTLSSITDVSETKVVMPLTFYCFMVTGCAMYIVSREAGSKI